MTWWPIGAFDAWMQASVRSRRVIVAVEPRLLAETLVLALSAPGVDVVIDVSEPDVRDRFDVAVIMGDVPSGIEADVVVRLPSETGTPDGSITTAHGTEPAALGDLSGLLETLDRYLSPR